MPEFTFENLQRRVDAMISNFTSDPEAWFMWNALAIVTAALGYTHLTPEEVFKHLKEGTTPQRPNTKQMAKEILQSVKELEAKNEDTPSPRDIITSRYHSGRC
ncbi:MAG: hypothetical protein V3V68_05210 [Nitrosomonadaceae bacterium]